MGHTEEYNYEYFKWDECKCKRIVFVENMQCVYNIGKDLQAGPFIEACR